MVVLPLLVLFVTLIDATLMADREANAVFYIVKRPESVQGNIDAHSLTRVTEDLVSATQGLGVFTPVEVAFEYANLAVGFAPILGYDPVKITVHEEGMVFIWLDTDTLLVIYNQDAATDFNTTSQEYQLSGEYFRNRMYFEFESGTMRIKSSFLIQDPGQFAMFAQFTSSFTNEAMCGGFVIPACEGNEILGPRPYLPDTGYESYQDCVDFFNQIPAVSICPFPLISNTTLCRGTVHAPSAIFLPEIHCSHTAPNSTTCVDTCLEDCSNCHADAKCTATFPDLFEPVYGCECNNGYIGDGEECESLSFYDDQCEASVWTSAANEDGLCVCASTFVHNPLAEENEEYCVCPEGNHVTWSSGVAYCVPDGRCIGSNHWECSDFVSGQSYSNVKCVDFGDNHFTPWNHCPCNYGFENGYEIACSCPSGRSVKWSDLMNGNICVTSSECTVNWHCPWPQTCHGATSTHIGTCS